MKHIVVAAIVSLCSFHPAHAQVHSPNVTLLANVNMYPSIGYNDCWGYTAPDGREYALLGVLNGTSIVDITDAPVVSEVAFIPSAHSTWKDIKTYQHYAYVVNESSGGLQIIDLSNLPISATLAATYTGFSTSHNIYIDTVNAMLYAEGSTSEPVRAISLANPLSPVQTSAFGIPSHDVYARHNIVYVSEGSSGSIGIFDLNNPSQPALLGRFSIPNAGYVHNAWLSKDGNYLMTTEETLGKSVKLWNIQNLNNVVMTSQYFASPFVAHNTHIKGDYAYISYYADGLRIVDVSGPDSIFEAGYYDTYPGPGGGFNGAWGAFPFFATGKVLISDRSTGLYVVFFEGAVDAHPDDPNPPANLHAYSDYATPTSMLVTWSDPTTRFGGSPLLSSDFTVEIMRGSQHAGSVAGGVQQFVDVGLTDGEEYVYTLFAKDVVTDSTSRRVRVRWIAGGSPVPSPPTDFVVRGNAQQITVHWVNPSVNIDGTPMDDLAGVRLYQNGAPVATFTRTSADTARADSAVYVPSASGNYRWHITVVDDETPQQESVPSAARYTPMSLPVIDAFSQPGAPDPQRWITRHAEVTNFASNPPSGPYSLNLNGHPIGGDTVDSFPVDLTGLEGSNVTLSYYWQPQGQGDRPEIGDSLIVYFFNDIGEWIQVRAYPGTAVQPFQQEVIPLGSTPAGGGSFFFGHFQVRFRSIGTSSATTPFDDWFIDDFSFGITTGTGEEPNVGLPVVYSLDQNYPNPFNPSTTISFDLPTGDHTSLKVFNLLGQEVSTLVSGLLPAGSHTVVFDATGLSSGMYFYRLESGTFLATRRMMVVK